MQRLSWFRTPLGQFGLAIACAIVINLGLYAYGVYRVGQIRYSYLVINILLSVIPLLFALKLVSVLRRKRWSDWEPISWTLAWLLFLPNSFYMVSDYIHLRGVAADQILYVAVLFTSFIVLSLMLGYASMYLVHRALLRRITTTTAGIWMGLVLLLCSFAIYIGRDLRWNSWDVLFNPAGLLFDISDRLLRPSGYPTMLVTMLSFFALLATLYAVVWTGLNVIHSRDRLHDKK